MSAGMHKKYRQTPLVRLKYDKPQKPHIGNYKSTKTGASNIDIRIYPGRSKW